MTSRFIIFFLYFAHLFLTPVHRVWRDAGLVYLARLESVCTSKGYRGFESPSLRTDKSDPPPIGEGFLFYRSSEESLLSEGSEEKQKYPRSGFDLSLQESLHRDH